MNVSYWSAAAFVALAFVSTLLWILTVSGLKVWRANQGFDEAWDYVVWFIVAAGAVLATAGALVV
jgi:hypothetical protein